MVSSADPPFPTLSDHATRSLADIRVVFSDNRTGIKNTASTSIMTTPPARWSTIAPQTAGSVHVPRHDGLRGDDEGKSEKAGRNAGDIDSQPPGFLDIGAFVGQNRAPRHRPTSSAAADNTAADVPATVTIGRCQRYMTNT